MVFNANFNNISVIQWLSVLLVGETGVPGENHWPVGSHWQTFSHNVVSPLIWRKSHMKYFLYFGEGLHYQKCSTFDTCSVEYNCYWHWSALSQNSKPKLSIVVTFIQPFTYWQNTLRLSLLLNWSIWGLQVVTAICLNVAISVHTSPGMKDKVMLSQGCNLSNYDF